MFTPEEFKEALDHIRSILLLDLDGCVDTWRQNYSKGDDPENYFSELESALKEYREEFAEDASMVDFINRGLEAIDQNIEELRLDMPDESNTGGYHADTEHRGESGGSRSIFDDVDQ